MVESIEGCTELALGQKRWQATAHPKKAYFFGGAFLSAS